MASARRARFNRRHPRTLPSPSRIDRLESKFDSLQGAFSDIKDELANKKVWALVLYIALAAGTFSTMARAFGWF
jgi:hypothetical protein